LSGVSGIQDHPQMTQMIADKRKKVFYPQMTQITQISTDQDCYGFHPDEAHAAQTGHLQAFCAAGINPYLCSSVPSVDKTLHPICGHLRHLRIALLTSCLTAGD
jgi:hypothetical protein